MPCGCGTTCGCNLVAGAGIVINRVGDTFTVSNSAPGAGGVPTFIQQTQPIGVVGPYVWYEIDNLGNIETVWIEDGT